MSAVMADLNQTEYQLVKDKFSKMYEKFSTRHIGPRESEIKEMLNFLGIDSLEALVEKTIPASIRFKNALPLFPEKTESDALLELAQIACKNKVFRSYIGQGFFDTITPPVILRNILENPGWYTQYTPYQAEIAQGRLEALINFQTVIADLTGLEICNASLLDEGTAAAEAMMMCSRLRGSDTKNKYFISNACHSHVIEVVKTRAEALAVEVVVGDVNSAKLDSSFFAVQIAYPDTFGAVNNYEDVVKKIKSVEAMTVVCTDLLALTLLKPPGEWGADIAVGSAQRFGVPLGFGGPHAAFFATRDEFKREIPGRLIGVSKDSRGKPAYRLALQTREQHIRRERATSNICTSQVLLAVMASMYAVYHGPKGLKQIAERVNSLTAVLSNTLVKLGFKVKNASYFDTVTFEVPQNEILNIKNRAEANEINFRYVDSQTVCISLDETTGIAEVAAISSIVSGKSLQEIKQIIATSTPSSLPNELQRKSDYLTHPVFNSYHSEHEMLRYITKLQTKDLSLCTSMIPLGSCTMKLNSTSEMLAVTWASFARIHPFAPTDQTVGYVEMITELEEMIKAVTGFDGVSLQPNAGSQGEYAGLLVIRAYHKNSKQTQRNICLIPNSAHGTNPASAAMAGMKVVAVLCDENGNVDVEDLKLKAQEHSANLAAIMITYPSTHGVFEESIKEICNVVHQHGGQVYMDGANMNAQVGLCRPGDFGIDVCHLNLHKTFCIPHGGGGPGVGPIAVAKHLVEFLPSHCEVKVGGEKGIGAVSSAPWGSAAILCIPWVYIKTMGAQGLKRATEVAILNANYIAKRVEGYFPVLYKGKNGTVAHECIFDLRNLKRTIGIEVADVAKRLMDYGFHAPTVSFPVVETLMVEPTESESKSELDRFCDALISIHGEIEEIKNDKADKVNNVLKNSPHTADMVSSDTWNFPYTREKAAYPLQYLKEYKFWPAVGRVDNTYGDRNLFCSCVPIDSYK